ncbi:MAG: heme ABC exporter ATP-binding protein CcmA, partial [Candidatus Eisenbacteria bacterium]|nr:heme ABC exporter ATP-binding protein CcmA [Candidatus Eisenbacteria bacterium]
ALLARGAQPDARPGGPRSAPRAERDRRVGIPVDPPQPPRAAGGAAPVRPASGVSPGTGRKTVSERPAARLDVQEISKSYGPFRVLDRITFQVAPGSAVGLVGPNGAGKSTLLRLLAGLIRPTAGRILVDGEEGRHNARFRRRLGYVSHEPLLYGHLSARENLRFYAELFQLDDVARRSADLLERVGLDWTGSLRVQAFSRGMIQRLTLARALLHRPEILLLDEPHTGLDPEAAEGLGRILDGFRREGGTMLVATHELHRIPHLVDRVVVLNEGRLLAERELAPGEPLDSLISFYRSSVGGAS